MSQKFSQVFSFTNLMSSAAGHHRMIQPLRLSSDRPTCTPCHLTNTALPAHKHQHIKSKKKLSCVDLCGHKKMPFGGLIIPWSFIEEPPYSYLSVCRKAICEMFYTWIWFISWEDFGAGARNIFFQIVNICFLM